MPCRTDFGTITMVGRTKFAHCRMRRLPRGEFYCEECKARREAKRRRAKEVSEATLNALIEVQDDICAVCMDTWDDVVARAHGAHANTAAAVLLQSSQRPLLDCLLIRAGCR